VKSFLSDHCVTSFRAIKLSDEFQKMKAELEKKKSSSQMAKEDEIKSAGDIIGSQSNVHLREAKSDVCLLAFFSTTYAK
jgi:hypothetical protein